MKYKLKVRRSARALVMLIRTDMSLDAFAVCRCDPENFEQALRYAQSRVALPAFVVGGDFAITAAEHVLDLRGVVAVNATDAVAGAAARLTVPLLLIGGSQRVAAAAGDVSRVSAAGAELAEELTARFIGVYA